MYSGRGVWKESGSGSIREKEETFKGCKTNMESKNKGLQRKTYAEYGTRGEGSWLRIQRTFVPNGTDKNVEGLMDPVPDSVSPMS